MGKDYYKTLGVEKSATQQEIKKAFRKQAHKLHPDKTTGDEAKFKEVNEAYQVLGDEQKRQQYDQFGSNFDQQGGFGGGMNWDDFMRAARGQGGGGAGGFGGVDLGDIFGDIFGFGGGRSGGGTQRGRDIQIDVEIAFEDAAFGVEKSVVLTKQLACSVCTGSGAEPGTPMKTCDSCKGQGQVRSVQRTFLGAMQSVQVCPSCAGSGNLAEKKCAHCNGDGTERKKEDLHVKIPAGIHDGSSIRISGKGEFPGAGGAAGDLYVLVHVKPDDRFVRNGDDVHSEANITYPQAVLGDEIKIQTLDGEKTLIIPAGTQSHQQFRLKGLGTEKLRGSGRGNHYVKVVVEVPKKLNKKSKKAVEELAEVL